MRDWNTDLQLTSQQLPFIYFANNFESDIFFIKSFLNFAEYSNHDQKEIAERAKPQFFPFSAKILDFWPRKATELQNLSTARKN